MNIFLKKNELPLFLLYFFYTTVFIAIGFLAQAYTVSGEEPTSPQILVAPRIYYPLDEVLYLEGISVRNATVELLFEKLAGDASAIRGEAMPNANGEWFFSERLDLKKGDWSVRARVRGDIVESGWSTPRFIQSVVTGFRIGSLIIHYTPLVLVGIAFLFLVLGLLLYSFFRVRWSLRSVSEQSLREENRHLEQELHERERKDAERLVEEHFSHIRKKVMEELAHFETKTAGGAKLTGEEEEHMQKLTRELRDAEDAIEKKIREVTS